MKWDKDLERNREAFEQGRAIALHSWWPWKEFEDDANRRYNRAAVEELFFSFPHATGDYGTYKMIFITEDPFYIKLLVLHFGFTINITGDNALQ